MNRVVLDTNIVVSALLVPSGAQAIVLMLALRGHITLCASPAILAEYEEVLHRPRLKLQPQQIEKALAGIRKVAHLVEPVQTLSVSPHESDNRFLECAEAAEADYFVTGNTRHFPKRHKGTAILTGRRLLDILAESETNPE
jgi:putative PIN family toxin of toxin-antitoxin system